MALINEFRLRISGRVHACQTGCDSHMYIQQNMVPIYLWSCAARKCFMVSSWEAKQKNLSTLQHLQLHPKESKGQVHELLCCCSCGKNNQWSELKSWVFLRFMYMWAEAHWYSSILATNQTTRLTLKSYEWWPLPWWPHRMYNTVSSAEDCSS